MFTKPNAGFCHSEVRKDEEASSSSPHRLCSHSFQLCGRSFSHESSEIRGPSWSRCCKEYSWNNSSGCWYKEDSWEFWRTSASHERGGRGHSLFFFFPFTFPFSQATVSCILVRMDPLSRCSTAIKSFPLAVEKKVIRLNTLTSDRGILKPLKVCFQPYLVNRPTVL